jgi:hypothetical protein
MDPAYISPFERQGDNPSSADEVFQEDAGSQETGAPSLDSASPLPKSTPAKSTFKTLPTIRDHTTDQLGPGGDEYLPREIDLAGEKKVMPHGALCDGREYRCRTFRVPNRGDKLFMLATECARVLGYKGSYLFFNKNRSLHKIIASQAEKDDLVRQGILPVSQRLLQVSIVTARSIFRQFGSRVIVDGRRVRDDYWETKAFKQGFTEADMAGAKRSGASRAGEAAASAAEQNLAPTSGNQARVDDGTAFILYRKHHEAGVAANHTGLGVLEISKVLVKAWLEETQEVRNHWRRVAEESSDSGMTTPLRTENPGTAVPLSDIQGAGVYPFRDRPSAKETSHRTATALPEQHQDASAPWSPVSERRVEMDFPGTPRANSSSISAEEAFAHVKARWSGAETTKAQLHLLESLCKHKPAKVPKVIMGGSTGQVPRWLRCEWEIPSVVRQMRESQPSEAKSLLESFITITGSRSDMECSTCAEFLEKEWGESGIRALEILSQGLALLEHASPKSSGSKSRQSEEIYATDTHIAIRVGEDRPDVQSIFEAIVWACTAIRMNPSKDPDSSERSQLHMSKAILLLVITGLPSQARVYGLERLTKCSDKDLGPQSRCWERLFRSGIVAFHSVRRQLGVGLKISFDMMVHLSGVENVYNVDGGIILTGFFTALVPISYNENAKVVQWHFEEVRESDGRLRPCSLPSVRGNWFKTQDINIFRTSECFLGWFARANILLGTRQLLVDSPNVLRWSTETREHHQSVRREGFEVAGQLGFTAGPINTNFQLVRTWRFHSNVQHFHRQQQYSTALRLGRGNVAIIIDSESKQVWLVPLLSVVLHLCHRYFQEVNQGSHMNNPLPFAEPSPDGALAASTVLEANGDTLVFGAEGEPDAENLRQLFLRINTNLLTAAGTREPSNRKTLFATELMAMATEPGRGSPLKKMKAPADSESWVGLFEKVDFVGVCSNIGQLIKPEPIPPRNPCTCISLPNDRYFLAAHMRCLDALSQREGYGIRNSINQICRLGERVFWNTDRVYWTHCPAGAHDPIWTETDRILQQISCKEKGKGGNLSRMNGQATRRALPEDGAVVFGGDSSKRILQSWRFSEYIL